MANPGAKTRLRRYLRMPGCKRVSASRFLPVGRHVQPLPLTSIEIQIGYCRGSDVGA